jgi:hypothetical protein
VGGQTARPGLAFCGEEKITFNSAHIASFSNLLSAIRIEADSAKQSTNLFITATINSSASFLALIPKLYGMCGCIAKFQIQRHYSLEFTFTRGSQLL